MTEEPFGSAPDATTDDVDRAVAAARLAFDDGEWPHLAPAERAAVLRPLRRHLRRRTSTRWPSSSPARWDRRSRSPTSASRRRRGRSLDFYARLADDFSWEEERVGLTGARTIVRQEPVGVVGAITPWNVPQVTIMSKLAPALLAGCTVVVKPAPETPLDALLMAQWVDEAGFPDGVVSVVPGGREVGEHLVRSAGVDKIAFTGSTAAGRRIGAICGEALRRVSLELGGKSAAIVLEDADVERTVAGLRFASFMNSGQACAAQTRVLAPRSRYDDVVEAMGSMADSLVVGDPADPATEIGPMVTQRQQERVAGYIDIGIDEGATVVAGGHRDARWPRPRLVGSADDPGG